MLKVKTILNNKEINNIKTLGENTFSNMGPNYFLKNSKFGFTAKLVFLKKGYNYYLIISSWERPVKHCCQNLDLYAERLNLEIKVRNFLLKDYLNKGDIEKAAREAAQIAIRNKALELIKEEKIKA